MVFRGDSFTPFVYNTFNPRHLNMFRPIFQAYVINISRVFSVAATKTR